MVHRTEQTLRYHAEQSGGDRIEIQQRNTRNGFNSILPLTPEMAIQSSAPALATGHG